MTDMIETAETPRKTVTATELPNAAAVEQFLKATPVVLIDVYSPRCAPCKRMAPLLDEMASEIAAIGMDDRIGIGKINIEGDAGDTALNWVMQSVPTTVVFHKEQVVTKVVGFQTKVQLYGLLGEAIVASTAKEN